ncbi:putative cytochrome P450 oxidoreductase [Clohesyomyces aquaticus]|uniref:Putative cytochrome P450 oxidoreductase n=1 Tax=Clohesyomyces aquaticus TaxID=1231657 RepID=A0A1Y1ZYV3_9PLEO|nr:putative cytochrome P450 oxidoreductase [Clohesyomyces aquaticus]
MGALLLIAISTLLLGLYRIRNVGRRPKNYPPGPPTLPIIGNIHHIPSPKPHHQFKKWADKFGPVYSLILGTSVMVALSTDVAVKELLDKRSNIYSSRPDLYIGHVLSGGYRMLLMQYGETWRMIRRTVHNHLSITAAKSYIPYQDVENKDMLLGFLEEPEQWDAHLRRYTNSLTTQIVFGFQATSNEDRKLLQLFGGSANFSQTIMAPAANVVDAFPFLKPLPEALLPIKKRAREFHEKESELYLGHWLGVKKAAKNGTANPCICVELIKSQETEGGSLLEAGSDTTYNTLNGWMQAMLLFPEVTKAAQAEIDRVCGERLPTLDDEPNMQYIRGCVKERAPHSVIRDDEYMGYKIPKGAGVVWDVWWALHNDEKRYPNPRVFYPTRYSNNYQTTSEEASNGDVTKRDHFTFGAGRRVCQGIHPPVDTDGRKILPDPDDLTEGLAVHPTEFAVKITARSQTRESILRDEWKKMEESNAIAQTKRRETKYPEQLYQEDRTQTIHCT